MTVSANDLVGRDYCEIWKSLVTRQNCEPSVFESYTELRNNKWERSQAAQGIAKSNVVQEAKQIKEETGEKENAYSVQTVPRCNTGLLSGKIKKSLGMYPEPP